MDGTIIVYSLAMTARTMVAAFLRQHWVITAIREKMPHRNTAAYTCTGISDMVL